MRSMPAVRLCLLLVAVVLQGCETVAPWERGNLAREDMSLDPNPKLNQLREHIFTSREASQGGLTGGGGGCGCN